MSRRISMMSALAWVVPVFVAVGVQAQAPPTPAQAAAQNLPTRPPLFFSESFKQNEKGDEHPASDAALTNANLEMKLYSALKACTARPGENVAPPCVQITGGPKLGDAMPVNVWTGLAPGPVAVTLRDKTSYVDMRGWAKVRWTLRTSAFHAARPVVKLADGTAWVGDHAESKTNDFGENEFTLSDLHWIKLDLATVMTTPNRALPSYDQFTKIDLSKVDEIGFVDLMPSSGHGFGGWVNFAKLEVYGAPVKR